MAKIQNNTKECPSCAMEVEKQSKVCPICGYEFAEYPSVIKWLAFLLIIAFLLLMVF